MLILPRVMPLYVVLMMLVVAGSASALAESESEITDIRLAYRAYVAGFGFTTIAANLRLDGDEYRMEAHLAVDGAIAELLPWSTTLRSWGRLAADGVAGVRVARLRVENSWRDRRRHVQAAYHAGEAVIENADPPPYDGARQVAPELTRDTIDPLSAALALGRAVVAGGRCARQLPVFDGRRRYDLLIEHGGSERLTPDKRSRFAGAATRCTFRIDRIAGFRPDRKPWIDSDKSTRVWFGRPIPDGPPMPVRVETPTPLGLVKIYLTEAVDNASASTARAGKPR